MPPKQPSAKSKRSGGDCMIELNRSGREPTEIELRHAFVCLGGPAFYIGEEVSGAVHDVYFLREVGYVPPFWRRSRLSWARPLVNDLLNMRTFWRWLRG